MGELEEVRLNYRTEFDDRWAQHTVRLSPLGMPGVGMEMVGEAEIERLR